MEYESFKKKLKDWGPYLKPFIESKECDKIYSVLKEKAGAGIKLAPSSLYTYKTFLDTPYDDLKCVIIGDGPYCKFVDDAPIATGVLFGANTRLQPDLREFYWGIEKDLCRGLDLNYIEHYDLEYLSKQGVLMLNSSLTCEKDNPNSHFELWKPFITFLLNEVISYTGVSVILMGENAQKYVSLIEQSNYVYCVDLPIMGNKWDTKNIFKAVNANVWDKEEDTIMWLDYDKLF